MGDDASDFTFCQVATNLSDDVLESPKIIPDIGAITISNATNKVEKDGGSTQGGVLTDVRKVREASNSSSSSSQTNGSDKQAFGGIMKCSTEIKPVTRKPVARAKVPFEKGYSQMDWLKVTRTHPDLAGLKGQSNRRLISMDEVRQHKKEGSVWTVLKGRVYNISPYMKFHPGGVDMLMKAAGKDCTSLFNKYHAWVNAEFLLEKCLVGVLDDSQ